MIYTLIYLLVSITGGLYCGFLYVFVAWGHGLIIDGFKTKSTNRILLFIFKGPKERTVIENMFYFVFGVSQFFVLIFCLMSWFSYGWFPQVFPWSVIAGFILWVMGVVLGVLYTKKWCIRFEKECT